MSAAFPVFVEPMLAVSGEPFDSPDYIFEIKWDGYRAIVRRDAEGVRIWSRNRVELTGRFPELSALNLLPPGCILDGEIVILNKGVPDFGALQSRRRGAGDGDTVLVVFDLLYNEGLPIFEKPLERRRAILAELVAGLSTQRLMFSEGIIGSGKEFFRQAAERGLEGITAKTLSGPYFPGKRSETWIKIKHRREIQCAIIGYVTGESGGLRSIAVASDLGPGLRYVGQVGSGFSVFELRRLERLLGERQIDRPIVTCPKDVVPVRAGLYCIVSYAELTESGMLRAPVCESWVLDS